MVLDLLSRALILMTHLIIVHFYSRIIPYEKRIYVRIEG